MTLGVKSLRSVFVQGFLKGTDLIVPFRSMLYVRAYKQKKRKMLINE